MRIIFGGSHGSQCHFLELSCRLVGVKMAMTTYMDACMVHVCDLVQ